MNGHDEKMWYSIKEAADYLYMELAVLQRKINGLNIETRTLPGQKGEFLTRRDVLDLEAMLKGPRPSEVIQHGQAIVHCSGSSKEVIDEWVQQAAQASDTKLDWMYRAGYVLVFCLGDEGERKRARDELGKPHEGIANVRILDDATVAKAKI
jgi:hypothetical protein